MMARRATTLVVVSVAFFGPASLMSASGDKWPAAAREGQTFFRFPAALSLARAEAARGRKGESTNVANKCSKINYRFHIPPARNFPSARASVLPPFEQRRKVRPARNHGTSAAVANAHCHGKMPREPVAEERSVGSNL
jgi:hypothetical protein